MYIDDSCGAIADPKIYCIYFIQLDEPAASGRAKELFKEPADPREKTE